MQYGKTITRFNAANIKEALKVVKALQKIDFDPKYFIASYNNNGLKVSLKAKFGDSDITFSPADEYDVYDPTGDSEDINEWDWQTEDSEGNTIGLKLWVVVRTKLLGGSIPRLAQFRRLLRFNNLGMLENMSAETISVVITPIEIVASS